MKRTFLERFEMKRSIVALPMVLFTFLLCSAHATLAATATQGSSTETQEKTEIKATEGARSTEPETNSSLSSTIGFPKLIFQLKIAGSKVVAQPIANRAQPVIVRIVETYPHGTDFRYDIEYKGLEPGNYNLADYLKRESGDETIPAIPVEIQSLLGPGQVKPINPPTVSSEFQSYYLPMLLIAAAGWVGGLLMILFYGRGKTKRPESHQIKVTVADRMRPLIDAAVAGELNSKEQAELERVLSSFWSKKLRLGHLPADKLREHLRNHPEASVMLNQIDSWLHRPASDPSIQVDIGKILEPYQSVNYEEIS